MKKYLPLLLLLFALPGWAQEVSVSVGIYAGSVEYQASGDPDVDLTNYAGKLALHFADGISLEVRAGKTSEETESILGGAELTLEADYYTSVYFRDTRPFNDWLSWYVLLGYSHAEMNGEIDFAGTVSRDKEKQSDISYGLGLSLTLGKHVAVNTEWKQIVKGDDFELGGFSLGVDYLF